MAAAPIPLRVEPARDATRWWMFFGLLLFLIMQASLGVWEMGGLGALADSLTLPQEPNALFTLLVAIYTWTSTFGMLMGMLWPVLFAGALMSILVALRWLRTRDPYLKTRLAFAVMGYFAFTGGLAYAGSSFPVVPNPGGSGQPALTWATWISMAAYIVLALLFGRASYCGVICPAATYWGGLGQSFIRFNATGTAFRKVASAFRNTMVALFTLTILLSITNSLHLTHFRIFGTDPAVFFSGIVWMVIWYLMLLSVPFVGNRAFTRLLCPMGTFMGWVSRFGMFRVKAVQASVCASCTTHECTATCEVALPVHAILSAKGQMNSAACVGCGNCKASCPHGNIFYQNGWTLLLRRKPTARETGIPQ